MRHARFDFQALLEDPVAYVVITDQAGLVLNVNSCLVREFDLDINSAGGRTLRQVLPEGFASALDTHRKRLLEDHQSRSFQVHFQRAHREVFLIASQFPLYDSNDDIRAVCSIANDVSELHTTQLRLEHANAELEQFAYIASHDLRAPMRSIDSLAGWIVEDLETGAKDDAGDKLAMLRRRVQRLEALLDDISLYSRVGKIRERASEIHITDMLQEVLDDLALPDGFAVSIASDLPVLTAPASPLRQIFGNLISNAVKHHDRQQGSITVTAQAEADHVVFAVRDDGPGIAPQHQERVFRMFQTLKSRDVVEGSGLGLAIVQKLVNWQGGTCWIESAEGQRGTTIYFSWPKQYREDGATASEGDAGGE